MLYINYRESFVLEEGSEFNETIELFFLLTEGEEFKENLMENPENLKFSSMRLPSYHLIRLIAD